MTPDPLVSPEDIDAFRRDGAVVLRNMFPDHWIDRLRAGIDADLANPTANFARHTKDPSAPAYLEDFWAWNKIPELRISCGSRPAPPSPQISLARRRSTS